MLEVRRLIALEINGEDVEADGEVAGRKLPHVMPGEAAEDAAFVLVDGYVGRRHGTRGAGFDLDEAQGVSLPGNEVEVAGRPGGSPATGDHDVAAAQEPEKCGSFTEEAGFEMLRARGATTGGNAFNGVDGRLHQVDAELEQHWGYF